MSRRSMVRARERQVKRGTRRRSSAAVAAAAAAGATLALAAPNAQAANFTVTNLNDAGAGSLRDAISQANVAAGADTITFASGLSGTIAVGSELNVTDALDVHGPGAGAITLDGADATRILAGFTAGPVSISGLTFTNGAAGVNDGGALYFQGSASLADLVVTSSSAVRGGGVFFSSNDFSIADSRFSGNSASYIGGGIASDGFSSGVNPSDSISIAHTVVSGNQADETGGGIALYDNYVDVVVDTSTITNNTITGVNNSSVENGGGIWFEDTYNGHSTTLSNSTVSGNSAPDSGGGVSFGENFYGPVKVVNSTVTGNSAHDGGGIQFVDLGSPATTFSLVDSTVTGNSATNGGGVYRGYDTGTASDSTLGVSSSVIAGNSASGAGPDVSASTNAGGTLTLTNSLLQNPAGATYTSDPAGSNIVGADPKLGPLADNGGPTKTLLPGPTSPLIDAGLANGLTTDQRGLPRTVDYPGVPSTHGSDGTDIGAVELPVPDLEVTDPVVEADSPQFEGKTKIKVKLRAGAGEDVSVNAFGRIRAKKGFPVVKVNTTATKDNLVKVVLKPRRDKDVDKIERSLANGKKVTAKVRVKLKDAAGNLFQKDLSIKLKAKAEKK